MAEVIIRERDLNDLTSACSNFDSTWVSDVEGLIREFIEDFTNGWASPSAQAFGEEIAACLESANKAVEAAIAELNARLGNAVGTHNAIHSTSIGFTSIGSMIPTITGMRALVDKFTDGGVGYKTEYKDKFKGRMDSIKEAYIELVRKFYNEIASSQTFSPYEQKALADGFENIKNIITNGMENLKQSFDERIANETQVVENAQEQNINSYGKMGSN